MAPESQKFNSRATTFVLHGYNAVRSAAVEQFVEEAAGVAVASTPVVTVVLPVRGPVGVVVLRRDRVVTRRAGHLRDDQRQLTRVESDRAVTRTDVDGDVVLSLLDHRRLAMRVRTDLGRFRLHVLPFRGRQ